MFIRTSGALLAVLLMFVTFAGADVAPPVDLNAVDTPDDAGGSITVNWAPSPSEADTSAKISGYEIYRASEDNMEYEKIADMDPEQESYEYFDRNVSSGKDYFYKIVCVGKTGAGETAPIGPIIASKQYFRLGRLNVLIGSILLSALVLFYIGKARSGSELFIRRIGGLEAVQEAVGRATEMGKPVLYVPGIADIDDIQTIASVTILGRVATMVAEYDAELLVPCCRSLVMSTAQEVVKEAYLEAGRPDAYQPSNIRYLTDDQFGFVAGVDGIMVREKPAANFYLGTFYAESLILAETGHSIGAIQIAGTAMPSQLPFFIAACDYTLIGEELYAASAYLSREPRLMGSLLGQDWGKVIVIAILLIGVILAVIAQFNGLEWLDISRFFILS